MKPDDLLLVDDGSSSTSASNSANSPSSKPCSLSWLARVFFRFAFPSGAGA